jgi:excisionase family DNA binding protein
MRGTGYLTTREAAEKLGVTVGRVQQFVAEGRLPSVKIGRDRFVLESDLALVAERKTGRPPKSKIEAATKVNKKGSKN